MTRVQINQPEQHGFYAELEIYLNLINEGGHLDNALLLTLVSETRQRFFQSMGYSQINVEGVGIIVADAAVQYQSEAFHGETLRIGMSAVDFNKYGCDLVWQACEKNTHRKVACGKTGIVFFDYEARKITSVPSTFKSKVTALTVD